MANLLQRELFETNRQLEFFSAKELSMQLGAEPEWWGVTLIKELLDNALDACETAGLPPDIHVGLSPDGFTVADNGPGMPPDLIKRTLDYDVRVSDKTYYVSPSRGQLGNALKCLWAAPYAVNPNHPGAVDVMSQDLWHRVSVTVNQIAQAPTFVHATTPMAGCKNRTVITVRAPKLACYQKWDAIDDFYKSAASLLDRYALFNPHATLTLELPERTLTYPATDPAWAKWRPSSPTSPRWYTPEHFEALIAAYLNRERAGGRARTIREFVAEFHGLSASAKQKAVLEGSSLQRRSLHDLVEGDALRHEDIARLLTAMQMHARVVPAKALGVVGREHLAAVLTRHHQVELESLAYQRVLAEVSGLPCVLEVAFGFTRRHRSEESGVRVLTGVNWSASREPPFAQLSGYLNTALVQRQDPVVVVAHLAMPRPTFRDRGKTAMAIPQEIEVALERSIARVTKRWTAYKRETFRSHRTAERAYEEMCRRERARYPSVKKAAYQLMPEAYQKASGQGRYVAHARQIMYAARGQILEMIHPDKAAKGLNSQYFTQTVVPNYMLEYPDLTADWDVVFDDRGHFREPHRQNDRECLIGLGTLAVRTYIGSWTGYVDDGVESLFLPFDLDTRGPELRFHNALFVEKEGFDELLQQAQIAERFDIAIMSTKGMSNTAARRLVDALSVQGVTIYVLHDFDKSGFTILRTLRTDTRRYRFRATPTVIDLGLTLDDVRAMDLQSERVTYGHDADPKLELARCGATPEEQAFLVGERRWNSTTQKAYWTGARVELNAMTSDQFVAWLERRLTEQGVAKVIPRPEILSRAYRKAVRTKTINDQLARIQDTWQGKTIEVPDDLTARVEAALREHPEWSWDAALWSVVNNEAPPTEEEP